VDLVKEGAVEMRRLQITTLGCKVNQYESASLVEQMKSFGWRPVLKGMPFDLCIINTCTVTQKASMQSRQAVRKAIRSNPQAVIIVTGCYAQTDPDEIAAISGVDYIAGHSRKFSIPQIADSLVHGDLPRIDVEDVKRPFPFQDMPLNDFAGKTRPFLKIQDGCDAFCSYCVVPYARGRSRSLPAKILLERVKNISDRGYKELVLTGIHLAKYGLDLTPSMNFLHILKEIESLAGDLRIRISSIEPMEVSEGLIDFIARSEKVCHHLHIPLQNGDDRILRQMNRRYSSKSYRELIEKIVAKVPDIAIGADVLAGFPGESDRSFERTASFIRQLPVAYLHVFPFSRRRQTRALGLSDQIPPEIIKKRCAVLREIDEEKRKAFYARFLGQKMSVLLEETPDQRTGRLKGLTTNYIPVIIADNRGHKNRLTALRLLRIEGKRVVGEIDQECSSFS
jgi:threonylcarbamoyladenosine tRNA methylthiotransferase MtaB